MNLEEELLRESQKSIKEAKEVLQDVKLLLSSDAANEINTLKSIGLDAEIKISEEKQGHIKARKDFNKKFGTGIVHVDEIRKMCNKYNLVLRPANMYRGTIPPNLGIEMNRYCKEKGIPLTASSSHSKFFVIAPAKLFVDYETVFQIVKTKVNKEFDEHYRRMKERANRIIALIEDPVLVYQTSDPNYFAIMKSWGNDFSPLRRLSGILSTPFAIKTAMFLFKWTVMYLLYLGAVFQFEWWASIEVNEGCESECLANLEFIGVIFSAIIAIIGALWIFPGNFVAKIRQKIVKALIPLRIRFDQY